MTYLYRQERPVRVAGISIEESSKELEVTCSQVVRIELATVEEHLGARRDGINASFDGLKALFVGHRIGATPTVRAAFK